MSNVVSFRRCAQGGTVAKRRLEAIRSVVEAYVSRLKPERLTVDEINGILRILDTANECILIVLSDFNNDPAFDRLTGRSREVKAMIEAVRERVADLPAAARSA